MNLLEKILSVFAPQASDAPAAPPPPDPAALARLSGVRRAAWLPVLAEEDGPHTGSKFSGTAALAPGEAWPRCPTCQRPMQLFLQLNGDELPTESAFGTGILQFFYCVAGDCEVKVSGWDAFSPLSLLRVLPPGPSLPARYPGADAFPVHRITGWTPVEDYPNDEERMDLGAQLLDDQGEPDDAAEEAFLEHFPVLGAKLGGWPAWVQGVEYPDCPRCGARMEHLFQIDSDEPLPYMWGDSGCGHITRCPKHPEVLAFAWACY